jgi:predicted Zn-dependent peptidase
MYYYKNSKKFGVYLTNYTQESVMAKSQTIRSRYDNAIFEERMLSNGVMVYLQRPQLNTDEEGILLATYPWVGSCIESPHEHGIAHFFEHVPFNARRLAPIQRVGGEFNGSTSLEWTRYEVSVPKDWFALAVKGLASLTVEAEFDDRVVARERKVISREYDEIYSEADNVVGVSAIRDFFGPAHPYGHLPIGTLPVIQGMTLDQLMSFRNQHYHAGNLRLVVGGAFSELPESLVLEKLERTFGRLSKGTPASLPEGLPLHKQGEIGHIVDPRFQRDHYHSWYFGPERLDDRSWDALEFLKNCLNGMQSPLFRELRLKRGWVYSSRSCFAGRNPFGWMFRFECATPYENFSNLGTVFRTVLERLRPTYIQEQLRVRQYERKSSFHNAINVAHGFPSAITSGEKKQSRHYWEAIEDELSIEGVLAWRDRLLAKKPFIFEAVTEE